MNTANLTYQDNSKTLVLIIFCFLAFSALFILLGWRAMETPYPLADIAPSALNKPFGVEGAVPTTNDGSIPFVLGDDCMQMTVAHYHALTPRFTAIKDGANVYLRQDCSFIKQGENNVLQ